MTDEIMNLRTLLEKAPDADFLREMIGFAAQRIMALEVEAATGAGYAEKHLPIVHLVFSGLKNWLMGTHLGVSPQHLQAYLNAFTFRFNRRFYPFNAFRSLLGLAGNAEAPACRTLYAGEWQYPTTGGYPR